MIFKSIFRSQYTLLLVLLLFGLIPRIYSFDLHQVIDFDGVYYAMLGKNLVSGAGYIEPEGIYQWYYPPLYPLNIGLFWLLSGNLEFSSKLVSLFYGTLSILLVYWISRRIHGKRVAIIAGILMAFHPTLIRFSTTDTAESQFIFLLLLTICWLLYAFHSRKTWPFCLAGLLFGLLFLSKPAGIQYFAAYLLLSCFIGFIKKWKKTEILKKVTVAVVVFSFFALPYLFFLKNHYGFWTLSELSTRNLVRSLLIYSGGNPEKVYQLNSDGTEMKYFTSSDYPGEHISFFKLFKDDPADFIKRYALNSKQELILMFEGIKLFAVLIIIFLCINFLYGTQWDRTMAVNTLILLAVFFPLLTAPLISAHSSRWVLPMIPIVLIWSANGIFELQRRLADGFKGRSCFLRNALTITIIVCWIFGTTVPFVLTSRSYAAAYPHEHKELGLWMKKHLSLTSSTTVMSPSPHVAFYADTKLKIMPWGTAEQIIAYAKHHGVEYIVIDDHFLGRARSQLTHLGDMAEAGHDIEFIKEMSNKDGKNIELYKVPQVAHGKLRSM